MGRGIELLTEDRGLELLAPEGIVVARLFDESGELKQEELARNLITQVGDQYYGERAAGIATPPGQVTGMRLGTGTTAATKTGLTAAIGTYIAASNRAIDAGFPTSALNADATPKRRISWRTTWPAGSATNAAITEAVITNETPLTDVAGAAANTIARVVFAAIAKGANDTLELSWFHELLGA